MFKLQGFELEPIDEELIFSNNSKELECHFLRFVPPTAISYLSTLQMKLISTLELLNMLHAGYKKAIGSAI